VRDLVENTETTVIIKSIASPSIKKKTTKKK